MELGTFSVSLSVKDIAISKAFYENLGFTVCAGEQSQNWLVMKNGDHLIGLFQNMFSGNILTFNPGWDQHGNPLESFMDIREIQAALKTAGIPLDKEVPEGTEGRASISLTDPDGNCILIDQHV
ncbi:VOC family protein [Teredinibacter turnerae]|uniref:VOC family protein n=1 Tax=Teredinibacter turnerae TaxID=2426 RepID=UPI000375BD13|nr:VOC family protein [Teredinibacter turnerae]